MNEEKDINNNTNKKKEKEKEKKFRNANLSMLAFDYIPNPSKDSYEIIGLVKNNGVVSGYKLSNNNIVSKEEGISLAKDGKIKGVGIAHRNDSEYLKSLPDGVEKNNLSSLPTVNE